MGTRWYSSGRDLSGSGLRATPTWFRVWCEMTCRPEGHSASFISNDASLSRRRTGSFLPVSTSVRLSHPAWVEAGGESMSSGSNYRKTVQSVRRGLGKQHFLLAAAGAVAAMWAPGALAQVGTSD